MQGVVSLADNKNKTTWYTTSNILDLGVGQNIQGKDADPYLTWLPFFTAAVLLIQITFAIKEKMRTIMLLMDYNFYDSKSVPR